LNPAPFVPSSEDRDEKDVEVLAESRNRVLSVNSARRAEKKTVFRSRMRLSVPIDAEDYHDGSKNCGVVAKFSIVNFQFAIST
jgi:hypothetical protein